MSTDKLRITAYLSDDDVAYINEVSKEIKEKIPYIRLSQGIVISEIIRRAKRADDELNVK